MVESLGGGNFWRWKYLEVEVFGGGSFRRWNLKV
jgi:hypothetical protein